jgi:hypothetical protein
VLLGDGRSDGAVAGSGGRADDGGVDPAGGGGGEEDAGGAAQGGAAGSESGGASGAGAAEPEVPFDTPVLVDVSDPAFDDDDPMVSSDLLELYFSTTRDGQPDAANIWRSTRETPDDSWEPPEPVEAFSTTSSETSCALSSDGLTMYLSSNRVAEAAGQNIWVSQRTSKEEAWDAPDFVPELSSDDDDIVRSLANGDRLMALARRVPGTQTYDIFLATRDAGDAPWSEPVRVEELSTANNDASPFLIEGGLLMYFSSNRATLQDTDIYSSRREAEGEPFAEPLAVAGVNSTANDSDPWVAPDLRYIIFASTRDGTFNLYEARR